MNGENYLAELATQLHCRGVNDQRINEIISEVESHLADSGEVPEEAFGPVQKYAEEMAVFSENAKTAMASDPWSLRTFKATGFDEMQTLLWAGQEGWELVSVGPYALNCRRPVALGNASHWQHIRRTGTNRRSIIEEMKASNWEPCGQWIVFHYFKRKVGILKSTENPEGN